MQSFRQSTTALTTCWLYITCRWPFSTILPPAPPPPPYFQKLRCHIISSSLPVLHHPHLVVITFQFHLVFRGRGSQRRAVVQGLA